MFTGIVEEVGKIVEIRDGILSKQLSIEAETVLDGTKIGDSIAVNGVCLTVTQIGAKNFCADVTAESLRRSNLGSLRAGSLVNLERAMAANGRFGGHIVSGHIDGTGTVLSKIKEGDRSILFKVKADKSIMKYIVEKGSVALDGISLTVASVTDESFTIALIPHTSDKKSTAITSKKSGDKINIEIDVIAKYVEKLCGKSSGINMEFLAQNGFC